ncbi:MAG TPA: FadR/GntR family transcriptional regulator [Pararhizobium sp.]|nr:FadR/GntR family transcriptional regulator [Pararhizobium sp.]
MRALQPLAPQDRTKAVLDELAGLIADNGVSVGERLPTEREMSSALGVSRSTVREVLRQWQALGIVEMRKGSGTYLRRRISNDTIYLPLVLEGKREGLLQMLEVRRGLETEAGALAASRADAKALANIEEKLDAMEAVHAEEGCAGPEDLAFHLSIYEACGNPIFGELLSQMRDTVDTLFSVSYLSDDLRTFANRSFPFHRELFDAIAAHDAARARDRTLAILAVVEEDIRTMMP